MQLDKDIESVLAPHLTKQLIKYAVGRAIFCPTCEKILDYRSAVVLTRLGKNAAAGIACGPCFDQQLIDLGERVGKTVTAQDLRDTGTDVDDGREL